jgi:hypothetical protein
MQTGQTSQLLSVLVFTVTHMALLPLLLLLLLLRGSDSSLLLLLRFAVGARRELVDLVVFESAWNDVS